MTISKCMFLALTAGGVMAPAPAFADDPAVSTYAWGDSSMATRFGVATVIGAGVTGFTDRAVRDDTRANGGGGIWDVRVTLGSHAPLALDIAYIGTSTDTKQLFAGQDAAMIGTAVEGALRFNVLPHATWNPYAFAGIGWQRYDLTGGTFDVSNTGMSLSDNSVVFPLGGGIEYRDPDGFVFDMRGTYRVSSDSTFIRASASSLGYAAMDAWGASVSIGYEL